MRILHLLVVVALVLAAAYVYRVKYESTAHVAQIAKMRAEVQRERDAVAALRAEWSKLDNPERIQALANRHLPLKPLELHQLDPLDRLPERPVQIVPPGTADPIGAIIETQIDSDLTTGSAGPQRPRPR